MEIVYEWVCGLDIHKDMIAACMIKKGAASICSSVQ